MPIVLSNYNNCFKLPRKVEIIIASAIRYNGMLKLMIQ